jgi:hypothetical protein
VCVWFGSPRPQPGRVLGEVSEEGGGGGLAAGGGGAGGGWGAGGCGGSGRCGGLYGRCRGVAAGGEGGGGAGAGAGGAGAGGGGPCGGGDGGCGGGGGAEEPRGAGAAISRELVCTLIGAGAVDNTGRAVVRVRVVTARVRVGVCGLGWGAAVCAGGPAVASRFRTSPVQSMAGASGENGLGFDGSKAARQRYPDARPAATSEPSRTVWSESRTL